MCWEAHLIYQLLYDNQLANERFIPILMKEGRTDEIPIPLRSYARYRVNLEEGYEQLYRRLIGQPHIVRPDIGMVRHLPTRAISSSHDWLADHAAEESTKRSQQQHVAEHNTRICDEVRCRCKATSINGTTGIQCSSEAR